MTLLSPDPTRTAPKASIAAPDRAPDWVADGTPEPLRSELVALLGEDRVHARAIDIVRYASDASPYRMLPQVVLAPRDLADMVKLLGYARRSRKPLVFRAGGTSLNGQAQTSSILVDVRRHWQRVRIEAGGERVRVQPGIVLGRVNALLARHGRRLGPDPASSDIACIGGVIANNSGGMRCGVTADSYRTVASMTFALANGAVIDTAAPDAERHFAQAAPELAAGLEQIRDEIRADPELSERIARKFEIKNTTGYRLCAFLDADTPLEIFRRLIVGSEGTLALIGEAVLETFPLRPQTAISLAYFADVDSAAAAVPGLVAAGATATELMVAPTLIAAAWNMPGTPVRWKELPPDSAALLVEFSAAQVSELDALERRGLEILSGCELIDPARFSREHEEIEMLWRVREGMQGLLAAMRPPGVSLIIEDVCFPPQRIAEGAKDLQRLLGEHGFLHGVAGHASAGNLHFLLTPNFGQPADLERYEAFMHELVELIVDKYDGSLKAEHGTGVNMAPYVAREWGPRATDLMWRIKELADPDFILGPGVVLNRDPGVHLRNLKSTPEIEATATKCIECGFCEPVCPSRNTTTTPRQRIVVRREMVRQPPSSPLLAVLLEQYEHDGIQTCAADGICSSSCPVGIDTGTLIKELRRRERTPREEAAGLRLAQRYEAVERVARGGLRAGHLAASVLGQRAVAEIPAAVRRCVSTDLVPTWPASMPPAAPGRLPDTSRDGTAAVYLPACINRIFGNPGALASHPTLPEALVAVSARGGLPLWIPGDAAGHCCATPWSSKGYARGQAYMARRTAAALWRWSDGGALPVMIDASSCAHGLHTDVAGSLEGEARERFEQIEILDSIAWVHDRLLPRLEIGARAARVAVHPTCSAGHLGLTGRLVAIAERLAEEVTVPVSTTCCGMAGDRGMLHPELPASALRDVDRELGGRHFDACVSSNRTCEIGLEQETGRPYASFVLLLEELTRR